ncbi:MAG: family 78 glycoside hydrolase catalytic domain [Firmicutes bacterium]|nr:family 78 glycoside hydrolase catalytic domain [Bacillota bacterium]
MKIKTLQLNHQETPVGIHIQPAIFTWENEWDSQEISSQDFCLYEEGNLVYKKENVSSYGYKCEYDFKPRTKYVWKVVCGKEEKESFFETGKIQESWNADWIYSSLNAEKQVSFLKNISIQKEVKKARLYIHGKGLYEVYVNNQKVGEEVLMPGYHSYQLMQEVQTYPLSLQKENRIEIKMGDGWYKGRFVFDGGESNIYTDRLGLICEIHVEYEDGQSECICSDASWMVKENNICSSSIYEGEVIDDTKVCPEAIPVLVKEEKKDRLVDRYNPVLKKQECLEVKEVIVTPKNEIVLDFGQNMTGWVEFNNFVPEGETIKLSYGEVLQNDCFYRDNLRTAKAEFVYTSDGNKKIVRPHFTYYGFRYVKVEGVSSINKEDFKAYLISSTMRQIGSIETSNAKVNQLFKNALWGQKDNFLDIPTDCPQRDERMGWTGDAGIISRTASENFDCIAFFHHYVKNIQKEQSIRNGSIPNFIPAPPVKEPEKINPFLVYMDEGISIWGDAGTLIPWHMYLASGDKALLAEEYPVMKDWVEYIIDKDKKEGDKGLWTKGGHLGDWLALDTDDQQSPFGATDLGYSASLFYYHSTNLLSLAAQEIGNSNDFEKYSKHKEKIKKAILENYFDEEGKLTITPTQTACVLALYFKVYNELTYPYLVETLKFLLKKKNNHLDTGFAGSPFICAALSENGMNDLAYTLLLNEDFPSWLFAVNLGATTIWERWNSLLEDGSISGTGMNSLNHYAYGSIVDWMYRYMMGLQPVEAGYKTVVLEPHPDPRIQNAKMKYDSVSGTYEMAWEFKGDAIEYRFTIPFGAKATFKGKEYLGGSYTYTE